MALTARQSASSRAASLPVWATPRVPIEPRIVYAAVHLEVVCGCGTANSWPYLPMSQVARCRWCGSELVVRIKVERREVAGRG